MSQVNNLFFICPRNCGWEISHSMQYIKLLELHVTLFIHLSACGSTDNLSGLIFVQCFHLHTLWHSGAGLDSETLSLTSVWQNISYNLFNFLYQGDIHVKMWSGGQISVIYRPIFWNYIWHISGCLVEVHNQIQLCLSESLFDDEINASNRVNFCTLNMVDWINLFRNPLGKKCIDIWHACLANSCQSMQFCLTLRNTKCYAYLTGETITCNPNVSDCWWASQRVQF